MNTFENQIQLTLQTLESSLDPSIWRTKLRIQEIMLLQNPNLKWNKYASYLNHLFTLLILGVEVWDIVLSTYETIDKELYEEGETEPILMIDIPQNKVHGTAVEFCERFYAKWIIWWKSYNEVREELKLLWIDGQVKEIRNTNEQGLIRNRVFYRKVTPSKNIKREKLPSLVVG